MDLACIGLNQQTAPVEVREKFAVASGKLADVGRRIAGLDGVKEVVVVSTCNRTEYYTVFQNGGRPDLLLDWLRGDLGLSPEEVLTLYQHEGSEAVRLLCRVVGGLDSMTGATLFTVSVKLSERAPPCSSVAVAVTRNEPSST